jgi:glycosyltransferase involved in cell wall biosynthesis
VRAFARVSASVPHELVLAGPEGWVTDRGVVLAPVAGTAERVRTIGRVEDRHLAGLYKGADLFAFPSRHEGFGIPVLEAMAQSVPVVCADIPALREVTGDAAVLLPADDVDAWTSTLERLLGDDAERAALGRAGAARAAGFSWRHCAEHTMAVYAEALHG